MSNPKPRRAAVPGVRVYQRGKTWTYRIELEPDELTGERRFDYKGGFATEAEAWTAGITANAEEVQHRRVPPSTRSVAAFFTEWLAAIEHSVKPTTHTNYVDYLSAYVLPALGKRRLQDVTVPMLNELYRRLLTHGRIKPDNNMRMYEYWLKHEAKRVVKPAEVAHACGTTIHAARSAVYRFRRGRVPIARSAGLAPKTVKNVHRMLHRAFSDAVAWRYIAYNPAVHASLPRMRLSEGGGRKGATWTPEQLAAWLRLAVDDRFAGIWVLVATTGMRRSELAGVERRLIDMDAGLLTIADTHVVVAGQPMTSDGKTRSGRRTIALDPLTVAYLRRHLEMLDTEAAAFGAAYPDHGYIACYPDGRRLHPDTITRRFNVLVDNAGVPRIRLHDVRHTYATVALDAGMDPKVLADRIGHANMAYTLQIYTHRSHGRDRVAADQVACKIFDGFQD